MEYVSILQVLLLPNMLSLERVQGKTLWIKTYKGICKYLVIPH